jgi:hypothetical protein
MAPVIKGNLLAKPGSAAKFGEAFVKEFVTPAFGARSKSEIDLLVFACLIEAGVIDPDAPVYDTARLLNITPTRVRNLLLNWQLRSTPQDIDLRGPIVTALKKTRFSKDGTLLAFGIENPLVREDMAARLKQKGVFVDASFSRELVKLPVDVFVDFLDDIVDDETKKRVVKALVHDKQVPDKSFKGLTKAVIGKLAEKVADEAGKEIAKDFVSDVATPAAQKAISFLIGLVSGDAKGATKGISVSKDEISV